MTVDASSAAGLSAWQVSLGFTYKRQRWNRAYRGPEHIATNGDGQAMPQRAGVGFDTWHFGSIRVAAEPGLRLHVGVQFVQLDEAGLGQGRVQGAGAMTLTQDEAIALRPSGISGLNFEHREIQRGEDVGGG